MTPEQAQALFTPDSLNTARRRALEVVQAVIEENDARALRLIRQAGEDGQIFHLVLSLAVLVHHHLEALLPDAGADELTAAITEQLLSEDISPIYEAGVDS